MSDDRRTRRRFLADLLFAGGAVAAASVLGYVATHHGAPEVQPVGALPVNPRPTAPSPAPPRRPEELQPEGDVAPPRPVQQIPAGAPPPPPPQGQHPNQGSECR